jgi:hypothetical protein
MKMKKLRELLEGYDDDADVCVVMYDQDQEKRHYQILGLDVLDWGASFEIGVKEEME